MWNFFAQVLVAVLLWIEERAKRGHVAVDSDRDDGSIRRSGSRIREWMREQDRAGSARRSDPDRSERDGSGVRPD